TATLTAGSSRRCTGHRDAAAAGRADRETIEVLESLAQPALELVRVELSRRVLPLRARLVVLRGLRSLHRLGQPRALLGREPRPRLAHRVDHRAGQLCALAPALEALERAPDAGQLGHRLGEL